MTGDVVVSQLGARMHYAVPRILAGAGRLSRLYTDIYATPGVRRLLAAAPPGSPAALRRLAGRVPADIPDDRITTFPAFALLSAAARLRIRGDIAITRHAVWAGRQFSELVARRGFGDASGLYVFAGDGLEQMASARRAGLWTVVEQINAPREVLDRLVAREEARFPAWQPPTSDNRFAAPFAARERAEWDIADLIICPSEFVRQGVESCGGPVEKCVVVPYGVDGRFAIDRGSRAPGPLRVLTVGQVGLRKGSPYVHAAAGRLAGRATFRMVGTLGISEGVAGELRRTLELTGPVPRSEIAGHYAWADVFLLPSVCEGSATVVYEALAAGLPVIVTENAGSVARHGRDGIIVPLGGHRRDRRGRVGPRGLRPTCCSRCPTARATGRRNTCSTATPNGFSAPCRRGALRRPVTRLPETMCGIAGAVCRDPFTARAAVRSMTAWQHHRGPDGTGQLDLPFGNRALAFGHNRLADPRSVPERGPADGA